MSGRSKQKERILQCLGILKNAEAIFSKGDIRKMEAILYIFAVKFLDDNELKSIKEAIAMTKLGQMIWNLIFFALKRWPEIYNRILKRTESLFQDLCPFCFLSHLSSQPECLWRKPIYKN